MLSACIENTKQFNVQLFKTMKNVKKKSDHNTCTSDRGQFDLRVNVQNDSSLASEACEYPSTIIHSNSHC